MTLAPIFGSMLSPGEDDARIHRQLRAFRILVLLHGAVRSWLWGAFGGDVVGTLGAGAAVVVTIALVLACHPRAEHLAPRIALPALVFQGVITFPVTDNHFAIEFLATVLLCLVSDGRAKADDERLVLSSIRWLAVLVLFHTGLQKVLYGHYFQGDFLAFMVGETDRFADLFALVLPADDIARLRGYDPLLSGQGPYRVDSLLFRAVSNLVWIAELSLAGLLVWRRSRVVAAVGAIGLVLMIQLGAHEFGFAALFSGLLLLFVPRGVERALPVVVLLYVWVLGAVLGWWPGGSFFPAGSL